MKPLHFLAALLLAAQAPAALAITLYKCVDESGKIAYADQPCAGKANPAKTLEVARHETDNVRKYRLQMEAEQAKRERREHERQIRQSQREYDNQRFRDRHIQQQAEREERLAAKRQAAALRNMSPEARKLHALRCAGARDASC